MKIIDPGHRYRLPLRPWDKGDAPEADQTIVFVKRELPSPYDGVIVQDVLRVLVDRTEYLHARLPSWETRLAGWCLRVAWWLYELRALARHRQELDGSMKRHWPTWPAFWPWNVDSKATDHEGHIR